MEAVVQGRRAIGSDINSLSVFLTRTKTTPLSERDARGVQSWSTALVEGLTYHHPRDELADYLSDRRTKNLSAPQLRALKKAVAIALREADGLPTHRARNFARCVLLRTPADANLVGSAPRRVLHAAVD